MIAGISIHSWLDTAMFYVVFVLMFLALKRLGVLEARYVVADIPIKLPIFYILTVGTFRLLIPDNHGDGYAAWVQDTFYLLVLALSQILHQPRKSLLGILSCIALFSFFYFLDYFNGWTDYDVWLEREGPKKFSPPYGPHRWWWDYPGAPPPFS